jgi:hypothetical protein
LCWLLLPLPPPLRVLLLLLLQVCMSMLEHIEGCRCNH